MTYELLTVLNFDINDLGTDKLKTELSNINTNQIAEQLNVGYQL